MSRQRSAPAAGDEGLRKQALLRTWLTIAVGLGVATLLFYRLYWAGFFIANPCVPRRGCALGPAASALASFVFASGVALLLAILLLNRGRYRHVFRMSRARLIGTAALAALAPLLIFSGIPWLLLPMILFGVHAAFSVPYGFEARPVLAAIALLLAAVAVAFPISCLLVSGLRSKLARLAGFTLIWWSAYCLILLLFGLRKFVL